MDESPRDVQFLHPSEELSVFDLFDTMGFSVTKRFEF